MNKVYTDDCHGAAVDYRRRDWSVIRLKGKIPAEPWAEYQERRMTDAEIEEKPWAGVGIVTGAISGIVVLDADSAEAQEELKRRGHPVTPMARTARGIHLYFKHPGGELPTRIGLGDGLDLKGDGGYVVAPPSKHPSGAVYEWVISPDEADLAELPAWVMEQIQMRSRRATSADVGEEIPNGSRNKSLTSIAGTLRRRGLGETAIYAALLGINAETCRPPLPNHEVHKIAASMARYAPEADTFYSSEYRKDNSDETNSSDKPLPFRTGREISEATPVETEWVAYPWFAKGTITEISGPIKRAGKTTLMAHASAKILDGEPFMGWPTKKTGVLYLTEQSPNSFRRVLRDAGLERDDFHVLYWHECRGLEWPDLIAAAVEEAKARGAGLLVVDVISRWCNAGGADENSPEYANKAMPPLKDAASQGLTVVYLRHDRKGGGEVGESGRGSSQIGGDADQMLQLTRPTGGNARPTVRVLSAVGRFMDDTPEQLTIELDQERGEYRSLGDAAAFARSQAMAAVVAVMPSTPESAITSDKVLEPALEQGCTRTHVYDALRTLTDAGTIRRVGKGRRGDPYRYYKPDGFISSETPFYSSDETNSGPNARPGDSESPDPPEDIHSSGTTTYIRTNKKDTQAEEYVGPNDRLFRERQPDLEHDL